MRVCPAIKPNGERCRGIVGTTSDHCPAHDPARVKAPAGGPPPRPPREHKPDAELKGVEDQFPSPC